MYSAVAALSRWFETEARDLPWRRTRDPYSIWISEVMLQQTQVATVIPYYRRFLERFPTVEALADAPEEDVLRLWSGLGYYSRARNLRKAAQFLTRHFRGNFPRDREAMLDVPGIGPYTAGAVLSIAFDLPEPLVDGNVQRVFARYFALTDTLESADAKRFFWDRAAEWVRAAESPRVLNQALMELGATICIKGKPLCAQCPLREGCQARARGLQAELPVRKPRREPVEIWWLAAVLVHEDKILLRRNPAGSWWADLWDFPHYELKDARAASRQVAELAQSLGARATELLATQKHTVTHHRLRVIPALITLPKRVTPPSDELARWVSVDSASAQALSSLARKVLGAVTARPLVLQ